MDDVTPGEVFYAKDLFKGFLGSRSPVRGRLQLGTLLINPVHRSDGTLQSIAKTASHQQRDREN